MMFKYKALSLTQHFNCLCDTALAGLQSYLVNAGVQIGDDLGAVFEEAIRFKKMQIEGIFTDRKPKYSGFSFHIGRIAASAVPIPVNQLKLPDRREICFSHDTEQRQLIDSYIKIFGSGVNGLGRILSRVYVSKLFRTAAWS